MLRIYKHDASLCQKELDLFRLVAATVPVPEVIGAESGGFDGPPFMLMKFVDGVSFHELRRSHGANAIANAAASIGETLAHVGRFEFSAAGWIAAGPSVTVPLLEGVDAQPRFVDLCLESENLRQRTTTDLRERVHALMWAVASELAATETEHRLVHGDFGKRNLLLHCREALWSAAAVLDWEFAISGSPLVDIGHFLRYEKVFEPLLEPHFSRAYLGAGGILTENWRRLARVVDLVALCESLTHDSLPEQVTAELVELVRATVENRDPQVD